MWIVVSTRDVDDQEIHLGAARPGERIQIRSGAVEVRLGEKMRGIKTVYALHLNSEGLPGRLASQRLDRRTLGGEAVFGTVPAGTHLLRVSNPKQRWEL
ncbi:MAG: hypothetical protein V3U11_02095, partial [Planctomycetota bacterium]